jgi:hypothetical protein
MDVVYSRAKLTFFALLTGGFAVISIYGLRAVPEDGELRPSHLFGIVVVALLLAMAARFLLLAWCGRLTVLTIDAAGVTFQQPALGAIPWTAIEDVVYKRSLLQRSLGFRFRPPLPRLPLLSRLLYLSYRFTEARPAHVHLPLPLLAQSDREIAAAILSARREASPQ